MAECIVNSTYEPSAIVQAIHDIPRFFVDHETDELNAYTSYYEYTQVGRTHRGTLMGKFGSCSAAMRGDKRLAGCVNSLPASGI